MLKQIGKNSDKWYIVVWCFRVDIFVIFGIGGAGTSICYSLIRAKARRLKLINRNTTKLNLLVNKLKSLKSHTEILTDDFRDYNISEYDIVHYNII